MKYRYSLGFLLAWVSIQSFASKPGEQSPRKSSPIYNQVCSATYTLPDKRIMVGHKCAAAQKYFERYNQTLRDFKVCLHNPRNGAQQCYLKQSNIECSKAIEFLKEVRKTSVED